MWLWTLLFLSVPTQAATLIYTNDVLGEIEPCGCRLNPYGGMLRKSGLIDSLKKKGEKYFLQIDAGDLLFESREMPESLASQAILQAEYLLKAHELLGHQIIVPGEKDFALGVSTFKELTKKTKIKFLAANLKQGADLLVGSDAHFEFDLANGKKQKVAVLGVVGEDIGMPAELKVEPVLPLVNKWVEENRSKSDLLIVVTHQGIEKDQALATAVKGIDLIIGAHTQNFLQTPETVEKTTIVQSSFRNQYVGVMGLNPGQFPAQHELVGLEEKFESAPLSPATLKMKNLISDFKKKLKKLKARNPYGFNSRN